MVHARLRELRLESKKKQSEIADVLGISQSTYSQYEQPDNIIPSKHIYQLSKFYNISSDYILGISQVKATPDEVEFIKLLESKTIEELMHEYNLTLASKQLDPDQERAMIKVLKAMLEKD